jgi:hypothetical protein
LRGAILLDYAVDDEAEMKEHSRLSAASCTANLYTS